MATVAYRRRPKGYVAFLIPLAFLLFIVAVIETRLDYLSTSYSFYGWLEARLAEDQIIPITSEQEEKDTEERVFYDKTRASLEKKVALLGKTLPELEPSALWHVVVAEMKQPTRSEFEKLARQGELNLPYGAIEWSEESVGAHLGSLILGFRSAVADLLWLKVDDYWHQGRIEMMLPMMYTVVKLDPHFIDAWAVGAWHLAYNAPVTVDSMEEKRAFIDKAIVFLQDGIKRNPRHWQLYFELGFGIYYVKLEDYKNAAHYLEQSARYRPPEEKKVDRMLLHAYERGGEYEKALDGWKVYLHKIDPESKVAPRFILQLQAEIAQRDGDEEKALSLWQRLYDEFPYANDTADIAITKIKARKAEAAGDYDEAAALWQSLIKKVYPTVLDEALANIARLNLLKSSGKNATSTK
jgi:tetratricopeptide (TPR) repeat protein